MLTALFALLAATSTNAWASDNHTCQLTPRLYSCENTTQIVDTCCTPVQGLVLFTEFWNADLNREGAYLPKESWGIHGLWPDRCDGTYGQYCDVYPGNDLLRQYDPRPSPNTTTGFPNNGSVVPAWKGGDIITPLLQKYGKYDLLAFMTKYWKSYQYPDWDLWQHEFSKHATCFSTFDVGAPGTPDCYGSLYTNSTEASIIDFLESVIQAKNQHPTYQWLAKGGITPSNSTGVNITQVQQVLKNASGATPYLGCSGTTKQVLNEVWYYSHSLGRPQDGIFKPLEAVGTSTTNCNKTAPVWYYQRTPTSEK